jgi:tuftelin-interacting protein 11
MAGRKWKNTKQNDYSSGEEELEAFQITDNDLFPNKKRRKFTKEHGIYGIWHRDSDDEDSFRSKTDYTLPVSFVKKDVLEGTMSGGSDNSDEEENTAKLDDEAARILGEREERKDAGLKTEQSKKGRLPEGKKLKAFVTRTSSFRPKKETREKDFGHWEKYTKGIGSKLLAKMGYKAGQGLGLHGEGIVNPVKASKRSDFDKPGSSRSQVVQYTEDEEEEEEQRKFEEQLQQWRIDEPGDKKKKPKYVYKSVEELKDSASVNAAGLLPSQVSGVKVIDMTGPQVRVLNNYSEMSQQHTRPDMASQPSDEGKCFLPVLLNNMDLLVEQTEQEILLVDKRRRHAKDMIVNLSYERERLSQLVKEEEEEMKKLSDILRIVEVCEEKTGGGGIQDSTLTLEECEELLTSIKDNYPREYKLYQLSSLGVAVVFPRLRALIQNWDMLKFPSLHIKVFDTWYTLLREDEMVSMSIPGESDMNVYDRLIWEVWMPKFRTTAGNWRPKTELSMVDLVETWRSLIPYWILQNILDQYLLPKLSAEVENWDPTSDTVPLHSWTHPWLTIMRDKMDHLYPTIRYKLANALNSWSPSDGSAHAILKPWKEVFTTAVMEVFLVKTILPKLSYCLQTMEINPGRQNMQPIHWTLSWRDMISAAQFAGMLDKSFFPKWIQTLNVWLSNDPNYSEITNWYTGWKNTFDSELLAHPLIKGEGAFDLHVCTYVRTECGTCYCEFFLTLGTPYLWIS